MAARFGYFITEPPAAYLTVEDRLATEAAATPLLAPDNAAAAEVPPEVPGDGPAMTFPGGAVEEHELAE
eukprot:11679396-Prorocentrum_lima.AAC.1